jgi:ribosomal protein S18 acetylase RimI-like enzyme
MDHTTRPAKATDLDAAARVLAAAFDRYSWTRWALGDERYAERLQEIQRLYLAHALAHGIVVVTGDVRAVAAFVPPQVPSPSQAVQARIAELYGDRLVAMAGLWLAAGPGGAWTLETVGVDPAFQGTGFGTAVTSAGLAEIDRHGAAAALETSDPRNVRLYERLGFTTFATTEIPDGPTVFSMARPGRTADCGRHTS